MIVSYYSIVHFEVRYYQGPPDYGRSCDHSEHVTIIAY